VIKLKAEDMVNIATQKIKEKYGKLKNGDDIFVVFKNAIVEFELNESSVENKLKVKCVIGEPIFVDEFVEEKKNEVNEHVKNA